MEVWFGRPSVCVMILAKDPSKCIRAACDEMELMEG